MKNKNILIGALIVAILTLSLSFAAFSTTLKVNGTGTISSTWGVSIDTTTANTKCTVVSKDSGKPTTCTVGTLTASQATATIAWASPGDVVTLTVRVKNTGTLNANVALSSRLYLTSSASTACTNVTATGNYTQYVAAGTATNGTAKAIGTTATSIGTAKILNSTTTSTYNYAVFTFVFTYAASATSGAGACTFTSTLTATQTA